jgi:hypothetical protein
MSSASKRVATSSAGDGRPGKASKTVPPQVAARLAAERRASAGQDAEMSMGEEDEEEDEEESARIAAVEDGDESDDEDHEEEEESGRIAAVEDGDESDDEEEEEEEEDEEEPVPPRAAASTNEFDGSVAYVALADMCKSHLARRAGAILAGEEPEYEEEDDEEEDDDDWEKGSNTDDSSDRAADEDVGSLYSDQGFNDEEKAHAAAAASEQSEKTGQMVAVPPTQVADDASSTAIVPVPPPHMSTEAANVLANAEATENDGDHLTGTARSQIATLQRRNRAHKTDVSRLSSINSDVMMANATLCNALRQLGGVIPAGAEMVAGANAPAIVAGVIPLLPGIAPPPPDNSAIATSAPMSERYCMRQLYLPRTSDMTEATKFKLLGKNRVWPHAIASYMRRKDFLAPQVQARSTQDVAFQLTDRSNSKKKLSETTLKPGNAGVPIVNFKLDLMYAGTDEKVEISSLAASKRASVRSVGEPAQLNNNWIVPMQDGIVHFEIRRLNVLSTMTEPMHRQFYYQLTAVDQEFAYLNARTPVFWVMSKIGDTKHKAVDAPMQGGHADIAPAAAQ